MAAYDHRATLAECGDTLIAAARDKAPVSGFTHNFYRYPARFSPSLAGTAIEMLTAPGDLVFDPFLGGGTTLVEALSRGRKGLGADISSLAAFVSQVKTRVYDESELRAVRRWSDRAQSAIHLRGDAPAFAGYEEAGYLRHMDNKDCWRLRKAIAQAIASAKRLRTQRVEDFARCVVLRTAQWALDGRRSLPRVDEFRSTLALHAEEMIQGARDLRAASHLRGGHEQHIVCLHRSSKGVESEDRLKSAGAPRLVITSPPYPGLHVLYHRWQVDGRKETPAPFWIANRLDGDGASYYTMGDRKAHELRTYFDQLRETLRSVAAVCDEKTTLLQVVAFSDPSWQLPRYLSVADDVGLEEMLLPQLAGELDGRLWRHVPNRKWYASRLGRTNGSMEVVLIHRKKAD